MLDKTKENEAVRKGKYNFEFGEKIYIWIAGYPHNPPKRAIILNQIRGDEWKVATEDGAVEDVIDSNIYKDPKIMVKAIDEAYKQKITEVKKQRDQMILKVNNNKQKKSKEKVEK